MEEELNLVLKRRKIPMKMKRPAAFKQAESGENEGVDEAAEDSDQQPLVSLKKPAAAKPAAAKAEDQGGDSMMKRPTAATPPGVMSKEGEAATRSPLKRDATPLTPKTPKASKTAVATQSGAKQAANSSKKIGTKSGAKKRPAAAVSPATHHAPKLKYPQLQWPGVPTTLRPVFQVNGWNVWTDLKGKKWRVRAIEWTNPSDRAFGFGQKDPELAKKAWARLVNTVSRAPSV